MSNFEKLTAMGADIVGGDLVFKHKVLGHFRNGDLHLTEEGNKMLEVDDVEVKEDKAAKPAAKKTSKKAAEPVDVLPTAGDEPEIDMSDV